jgi:hypothetical protein
MPTAGGVSHKRLPPHLSPPLPRRSSRGQTVPWDGPSPAYPVGVLWSFRAPVGGVQCGSPASAGYTGAGATIDTDGSIFVASDPADPTLGTGFGQLYKLSPSGAVIWSVALPSTTKPSAPTIDGALVLVYLGLFTPPYIAFDKATGATRWTHGTCACWSSGLAVDGAGRWFYCTQNGGAGSGNTTTGALLWTQAGLGTCFATPATSRPGRGSPANGTLVYFALSSRNIRAVWASTGVTAWDSGPVLPGNVNALSVGPRGEVCSGTWVTPAPVVCVNGTTGAPLWQTPAYAGGQSTRPSFGPNGEMIAAWDGGTIGVWNVSSPPSPAFITGAIPASSTALTVSAVAPGGTLVAGMALQGANVVVGTTVTSIVGGSCSSANVPCACTVSAAPTAAITGGTPITAVPMPPLLYGPAGSPPVLGGFCGSMRGFFLVDARGVLYVYGCSNTNSPQVRGVNLTTGAVERQSGRHGRHVRERGAAPKRRAPGGHHLQR